MIPLGHPVRPSLIPSSDFIRHALSFLLSTPDISWLTRVNSDLERRTSEGFVNHYYLWLSHLRTRLPQADLLHTVCLGPHFKVGCGGQIWRHSQEWQQIRQTPGILDNNSNMVVTRKWNEEGIRRLADDVHSLVTRLLSISPSLSIRLRAMAG